VLGKEPDHVVEGREFGVRFLGGLENSLGLQILRGEVRGHILTVRSKGGRVNGAAALRKTAARPRGGRP